MAPGAGYVLDPTTREPNMTEYLRPLERRVLAMRAEGLDPAAIGRRLRKSPAQVERIIEWTRIPRSRPPMRRRPPAIERRVVDLRAAGESHEEIARRFRRSPEFIRRVEGLAHFRKALELLG